MVEREGRGGVVGILSKETEQALLQRAERLLRECKYEQAEPLCLQLAAAGCGRAMYFLRGIHKALEAPSLYDPEKENAWYQQGAAAGDLLCQLHKVSFLEEDAAKQKGYEALLPQVIRLAEAGDVYACYELGSFYLWNTDVPRNLSKASAWFSKAAQEGLGEAMNQLAICYDYQKNYGLANVWYELAGEAGLDWGWNNLGHAQKAGLGTPKDLGKALVSFAKAYDMGRAAAGESANEIARIHWEQGQYQLAHTWCKKAGEAGYGWGWFNIAEDVENGRGVKPDAALAVEYYQKAYALGGEAGAEAANRLGLLYAVQKHYAEAASWYQKAGEGNLDWGWFNLAECYRKGRGAGQDLTKAQELYEKCYGIAGEAAGDAANQLGLLLSRQDKEKEANPWFAKAGEKGNAWGWYNLAENYEQGRGTPEDWDKALEYYTKAYLLPTAGDLDSAAVAAAYAIAVLYQMKRDYEQFEVWYQRAQQAKAGKPVVN